MPLDPAARVLRARMGAYAMHSKNSLEATTAAGRAAADARFIDMVDPERTLSEAERARRVQAARREHMTRLAFRSAQARKGSIPPTTTKTPSGKLGALNNGGGSTSAPTAA
jgi:hypothetical protein